MHKHLSTHTSHMLIMTYHSSKSTGRDVSHSAQLPGNAASHDWIVTTMINKANFLFQSLLFIEHSKLPIEIPKIDVQKYTVESA